MGMSHGCARSPVLTQTRRSGSTLARRRLLERARLREALRADRTSGNVAFRAWYDSIVADHDSRTRRAARSRALLGDRDWRRCSLPDFPTVFSRAWASDSPPPLA